MEGKTRILCSLLATVVAATITYTSADFSIDVKRSPPQTLLKKPGEDANLKCVILGENYNYQLNPVEWKKNQPETGEGEVLMNNAGILAPGFSPQKFRIDFVLDNSQQGRVEYTLRIKGLSAGDTGLYTCYLLGSHTEGVTSLTHRIHVVEDIDTINLVGHTSPKEWGLSDMTYDKDKEDILSCQTVGGEPPAILTLTIGGRNVTSEMKYESKVTFDPSGGPGQKVMKRTVRLYNDSFLARPEDDKAIIMCSAMVPAPNSDFKADAQATMHVVYRPMFSECGKRLQLIYGEMHVNITCRVSGNPAPTPNSVWWVLSDPELVLHNGESDENYRVTNQEAGDKAVLTTLTIGKVGQGEYGSVKVKASNRLGESIHETYFTPDAGISVKASSILVLMAAISVTLFQRHL